MIDWTPTEVQVEILCLALFGLMMLLGLLTESRLERARQERRARLDREFDAAMVEGSARVRDWERKRLADWQQDARVESERCAAALAFMVRKKGER
jgi:hypothetical protein